MDTMPWCLHEAIKGGDEELVVSLVEKGASVNGKDDKGDTPLHVAASNGLVRTTLLLLKRGADKDSRDEKQRTPLHLAAAGPHALVVRVLMENGADVTLRSDAIWSLYADCIWTSLTPVLASLSGGFPDNPSILETMIEFGADVNDTFDNGRTALHMVTLRGDYRTMSVLVGGGANLEARDPSGRTPLSVGAQTGFTDPVRSLLHYGANPNTQDNDGSTPLHWLLEVMYADDDPTDVFRYTGEAVDLLLEAGADESLLDGKGRTPMQKLLDVKEKHSWTGYEKHSSESWRLLENAPADRAARRWHRRAPLVMCVARHRRGEAELVDEAAGGAGDTLTRFAAWLLDAGLETGMAGIFRTIVRYL